MTRIRTSAPIDPNDRFANEVKALREQVSELQRSQSTRLAPRAQIARNANQSIGAASFASVSFDAITQAGLGAVTGTAPITLGSGWWLVRVFIFAGAGLTGSSYVRITFGTYNYDRNIVDGDSLRGDHLALHPVAAGGSVALSAGVFNATAGSIAINAEMSVYRLGDA